MNKLKKIVIGFWTAVILIPSLVYAVQITVPSAPGNGYMLISTTTGAYIATTTSGVNLGWINATSTKASIFPYASTTAISSGNAWFSGSVAVGTTSTSALYADIGPVTSLITEAFPTYSLGVHAQTTGSSTLLITNGGGLQRPAAIMFKSSTAANNRPFTSGCLSSGFAGTGYNQTYLSLTTATAANTCNATPELTILAGKIGINTSLPAVALDVVGTVRAQAEAANVNNITNDLEVRRTTNDSLLFAGFRTNPDAWIISATFLSNGAYKPLSFATSDAIRETILANGVVGIATTTPSSTYQLAVAGTGGLYVGGQVYASSTVSYPNLSAFATGDSAVCQRTGSGLITVDSGVTSCIVSTKAAKHDIKSSETVSSLERIMKLNPVAFEYNENNKPDIGLIAEEVSAVDPRYAQYDPKTLKPKAINWAAITSDLIKTTQDQETRLEALEKLNGIKPNRGSMLPTVFGGVGLLALGAGGVYLSKKKK